MVIITSVIFFLKANNNHENNSEVIPLKTKVEICGINTATMKGLKNGEILDLLKLSRNGDKKAREKLIYGNLKLVLSVIQRFSSRCESADDLFQVGCIGLIKAIDNFDLSQGVQFSTYGVPMIIGEIRRFLRDNNSVRVSRSMRDTAYHAMQVKEEFINKNNREPTVEEIAEKMALPVRQVVIALESVVEPVSLYEPVYSDSGDTLYVVDQVGDFGGEDDWIDEISIKEAIRQLNDREKQILHKRFMLGKTQIEVAQEIGISQAQVSRLEKVAMDKLRGED